MAVLHYVLYLHLLTTCVITFSVSTKNNELMACDYRISGSNLPKDFSVTNCTTGEDDPSIIEWRNLPYYPDSDFPINVTIYPYICYYGQGYSAWNTTFTVLSKEVTGFIFRYQKGCTKYELCRIYNFTNYEQVVLPGKFWHDAYYVLPQQDEKCMAVEVAVLPSYKWKKRFIFQIPSTREIEEGYPLAVIDMSKVPRENSITAYYTCPTSPKLHEDQPTFYSFLKDHTNHQSTKNFEVGSCNDNKTLSVLWENLQWTSLYSVAVLSGSSCQNGTLGCVENHSPTFGLFLDDSGVHWTIVLIAVSCAVVIISAIIIVFKRKPRLFGVPGKQQQVLLLYSHDIHLHSEAVAAFASYLKARCGFSVLLDSWDLQRKNPYDWLNKSISDADFVCLVWSQGAYAKATQPKVLLSNEPDYLGGDLFTPGLGIAKIQICQEMRKFGVLKQPRFCHVRLPYVSQSQVASDLRYLQTFKVPNQMHKLVKFLCSSNSPSCGFCFGSNDLLENDLKVSVEGRAFLDAVAKMEIYVQQKPEWFQEVLCEEKDGDVKMECHVDVEIKGKYDDEDEEGDKDCDDHDSGDDHNSDGDDDDDGGEYDGWTGDFPPRLDQLPLFSVFGGELEIDTKRDFDCKPEIVMA